MIELTPSEKARVFFIYYYALPLFITPNHPANGKTPIELGLAVAKNTEG